MPELVDRRNVQQANGLVRATADALSVGGWALAGLLLVVLPISAFFALNAASFFLSAVFLLGVRTKGRVGGPDAERPRIPEGFAALRPLPVLAASVVVLGLAVTLSSGTWIVGVPELVRSTLGLGAGSFSLVAAAYAFGSICAGAALGPLAGAAQGAREHAGVGALPARLCAVRGRRLAAGRAGRRARVRASARARPGC